MNQKNQKKLLVELFSGHVFYTLSAIDDESLLRELNEEIIDEIIENKKFKKELEEALYQNLEKITHKKFFADNKPHAPSVRNWLSDFIKMFGSNMFDNVVLSRYLTESANTRILEAEEKKLVRKLLILYRNLKFFPHSLEDSPPEEWEIVPIDRGLASLAKEHKTAEPPKSMIEKEIDDIKLPAQAEKKKKPITKQEKIKQFQSLAQDYPVRSLERRAIEEEIKKLN